MTLDPKRVAAARSAIGVGEIGWQDVEAAIAAYLASRPSAIVEEPMADVLAFIDKAQELARNIVRAGAHGKVGTLYTYANSLTHMANDLRPRIASPQPHTGRAREPLTSAWLGYWPGAGSIDSVTRVTRSEAEAKRWRADGADVTELVERAALNAALTVEPEA